MSSSKNHLLAKISDSSIRKSLTSALTPRRHPDGEEVCKSAEMLALRCVATKMQHLRFSTDYTKYPWHNYCQHCYPVYKWLGSFFADDKVREEFRRLQHVFIDDTNTDWSGYEWEEPTSCATGQENFPLLRLPALKVFEGAGLCIGFNPEYFKPEQPWQSLPVTADLEPSSTLEEIYLGGAKVGNKALQAILSATKILKVFHVRWEATAEDDDEDVSPFRMDSDPLFSFLLFSSTRKPSSTSISTMSQRNGFTFEQLPGLGPLVELKTLEIDENPLIGWTHWNTVVLSLILPTALEYLTIHTYGPVSTPSAIGKSFRNVKTPNFQNLVITFDPWHAENKAVCNIRWMAESPEGSFDYCDVGTFRRDKYGSMARVVFSCWAEQDTATVMAEFGGLLEATGHTVLHQMMKYWLPVSVGDDDRVVVYGARPEDDVVGLHDLIGWDVVGLDL